MLEIKDKRTAEEKKYDVIYGIKSVSPERFPIDVLKAYLNTNRSGRWYGDSLGMLEIANKRLDEEEEALKKAIELLEKAYDADRK